jgi:heme/copper-type cytochrome/quinol oxidase subunit 2
MNYRKIVTTLMLIFIWRMMPAQAPDMYPPTVPEPVENPVWYIIITVAVIAIYLVYRYSQNQKRKKKNQDNKH